MLDEIGLFDERFFLYGDDAELGLRGRVAGWTCALAPAARRLSPLLAEHGRVLEPQGLLRREEPRPRPAEAVPAVADRREPAPHRGPPDARGLGRAQRPRRRGPSRARDDAAPHGRDRARGPGSRRCGRCLTWSRQRWRSRALRRLSSGGFRRLLRRVPAECPRGGAPRVERRVARGRHRPRRAGARARRSAPRPLLALSPAYRRYGGSSTRRGLSWR